MKVMQRTSMKMVPGKMTEAMGLIQEQQGVMTRWGMPPVRYYRPFAGGGDAVNTIFLQFEWDSIAAMEAFYEKSMADPEMLAVLMKWDGVLESHTHEIYMPMPML